MSIQGKMKSNHLKWFFSILVAAFFLSCSDRPKNALSEKEMVNLLVDMQLAEAYENTLNTSNSKSRLDLGKRVLEAHNISQESLDTTLAWYGRNVDDYAELYDKVDKEILKRKKKYTAVEDAQTVSDDLWPYPEHLLFSSQSDDDTFSFIFPISDLEKGNSLHWNFYLPNSTGIKSILGVEYSDGRGEVIINNSNKSINKIEFQTDTAKEVKRIFGSIHIKDSKAFPVYIDSIALETTPLDTLIYKNKKRNQKTYHIGY